MRVEKPLETNEHSTREIHARDSDARGSKTTKEADPIVADRLTIFRFRVASVHTRENSATGRYHPRTNDKTTSGTNLQGVATHSRVESC